MKKLWLCLPIVLILALCLTVLGEDADGSKAEAFKLKYEERVFNCLKTLARFACDELSVSQATSAFQQNTPAWNYIQHYDRGWFSKVVSRSFSDFRTENWKYISDTEFEVDVYGDYNIGFNTNNVKETFHLAYHFCMRQTVKDNDFWQIYDFYTMPSTLDVERAQKFTEENAGITVEPVTGISYTGFMTIIDDPSRIYVETITRFGSNEAGKRINAYCDYFGAVGGFNGGGFADTGGGGSGGNPYGLVISNGVVKRGHTPNSDISNVIMGFDNDNVLHVGAFSYSEYEALNLRDAMAFHPVLVQNSENAYTKKESLLYTVRTAIGQDADGRVLVLVTKGRQPDSFGASLDDLVEVMLEYGAVCAGNLDGGSSTCMYLNGESVYSGYRIDCSRRIPCAFLIKPIAED